MVFLDIDLDGIHDPGETTGTTGVTVRLYRDADGDGVVDPGETLLATVDTGAGGTYGFTFAATGDFVVDIDTADLPAGHSLTSATALGIAFGTSFGLSDPDNDFGHQAPAAPTPPPPSAIVDTATLPPTSTVDAGATGRSPGSLAIALVLLALGAIAGSAIVAWMPHRRRLRRGAAPARR